MPGNIILCRNVMIYFNKTASGRLIEKFHDSLTDVIDHSLAEVRALADRGQLEPAIRLCGELMDERRLCPEVNFHFALLMGQTGRMGEAERWLRNVLYLDRNYVLAHFYLGLVCFERPSGSVLLESIADTFGPAALGVVLTGMGEDGARGLAEICRRGGYTIAESKSAAVVYGMPGAAVKLGAVCTSLPLEQIPQRLVQIAARRQEVA